MYAIHTFFSKTRGDTAKLTTPGIRRINCITTIILPKVICAQWLHCMRALQCSRCYFIPFCPLITMWPTATIYSFGAIWCCSFSISLLFCLVHKRLARECVQPPPPPFRVWYVCVCVPYAYWACTKNVMNVPILYFLAFISWLFQSAEQLGSDAFPWIFNVVVIIICCDLARIHDISAWDVTDDSPLRALRACVCMCVCVLAFMIVPIRFLLLTCSRLPL